MLNTGDGRVLKKLRKIADQVNSIEEDFEEMTDAELREQTDEFRERLEDGETLDDILPEAFATSGRLPAECWTSVTSTSRSWVVPPCTWATSPR